ncbi:heme-binding beta-barrel domain-containing protein [Sphingomonas sp. CROZ-RG-20F-R02-07]|uniref:FABP family protein n=1 Tax=Sphingomonas sp. CROZ-RG-20F-R02-07 TaxID=2914832 RepID=UPI001F57C35C|nr:heme-binding beta-barrel domain-containing protein [Sphingomonas sp. CROZ-RG-20F-R02-07]
MSSSDVFSEQSNVDPDTLANLGPLARLAGKWRARKGLDINPKADAPERRVFIETIDMQPIDPQSNGPQLLYGLHYHIHITTEEEDITFHDQVGYWLWEKETGLVMQTVAIPRGQVALAAGKVAVDAEAFSVLATRGHAEYGICSTAFLEAAFRTDSYRITITFNPDGSWSYVTDTELMIQGRDAPFMHQDRNTLHRIGDPRPNPWAAILARRKPAPTDQSVAAAGQVAGPSPDPS